MKPLKGRVSGLLLQLCCILGTLGTSAALNCSNHHELLVAQTKCFQDQGINFTVPDISGVDSGYESRNLWMEALIIQKSPELCQRPKEYQAAVECDMKISIGCVPKEKHDMLPDLKSVNLLVPAICDDARKVNFPCAKTKIRNLMACSAPKSLPEKAEVDSPEAAHIIMCKFFEQNHDCQVNVIMECGCNAVRILDMFLREVIYPLTCPPMAGGPVMCDPAKVGYMASDGNPLAHYFAFPMFIFISFIALELVA